MRRFSIDHTALESEQEVEEEEEQIEGRNSRSTINPFDLLNDDDPEDEQEDEAETADETLLGINDEKEPTKIKGTANVVSTSNQKSKKKKKKKNKVGCLSTTYKVEKPLDVDLETLSLDSNSYSHQHNPKIAKAVNTRLHLKQSVQPVLQVDLKYLNAENELRRIFGSKVVKSFEKSQQTSSSRQIWGGRHGVHIPRKTNLVTPSEHWPRWDGSLSMEFLEVRDGLRYFRFTYDNGGLL